MNENGNSTLSALHGGTPHIGKLAAALLIIMSALFGCAAIVTAVTAMIFPCLLLSAASVGILAVLFLTANPLPSLLSPALMAGSAILLGAGPLASAEGAVAILLTAAVVTLLTAKGFDPFPSRAAVVLVCSLIAALAFAELIYYYKGSFWTGIDELSEYIRSSMESILASLYRNIDSADVASAAEDAANISIMLLPGVLCCLGILNSWLIFLVARVTASALGCRRDLFPAAVSPRPLAVVYIVLFVLSLFMGGTLDGVSVALMNARMILTLLFFGEGLRILVTAVKLKLVGRSTAVTALIGVLILLFAGPVVPALAAAVIIRSGKRRRADGEQ